MLNAAERKARLDEISRVVKNGPFRDNWASLSQWRLPEWYRNAKFGIFIHWGVYAVPAFNNEWYPRNMYVKDSPEYRHHLETYGPHRDFGYKDFIPLFKAEKFDPDAWAALFEEAGARYVIPVGEHHDGFQMYKSELSRWNAAEMGPCRDTSGELKAALDKRGIPMGISSHRIEHWFFLSEGRAFDSDIRGDIPRDHLYWPSVAGEMDLNDPDILPPDAAEYMEDWLLRCCEMVDRFSPAVFYFDWWIMQRALGPYLKKFAAYYYNRAAERGVPAAINYKHEAFMFGSAVPDVERGHFADVKPYFWQTDTAIAANSWCYTEQNIYKTPGELIRVLADVTAKNGTLLLNVGPKADGTIFPQDTAVLRAIGAWLKVNGEAIYDTRPWRFPGEGPTREKEGMFSEAAQSYTREDFRFTVKGGCLYVTAMAFPRDGRIAVRSLAGGEKSPFSGFIEDVEALGFPGAVSWTRDAEGLHIFAPRIQTDLPVCFRVTVG